MKKVNLMTSQETDTYKNKEKEKELVKENRFVMENNKIELMDNNKATIKNSFNNDDLKGNNYFILINTILFSKQWRTF